MFIPLMVRHGYERKPIAVWTLASMLALVNLFFLLVPGWILDARYPEMLRLFKFDRDNLQAFNFITYAIFFPNPWLFIYDLLGLLFFGMAVECRFGWLRTLLLIVASIFVSAFFHGSYQPRFDIAGMTGAVFGLIGACVIVYSYSETDGIALVPVPPTWKVGFTYTWTIFLLVLYAAAGMGWSYFITRGNDTIQIMSVFGMGGGLAFGAAMSILFMGGKIPLLNPKELDPSMIQRMEDLRRRVEVQQQLAEDGFFSASGDFEESLAASAGGEAQTRESSREDHPIERSTDVEVRKRALTKLVMLKNVGDLAQEYKGFTEEFPHGCLASGPQMDVADMLEKGFFHDLALHAFERLVQCHPQSPAGERALLNAGRLCAKFEGREKDGVRYLERFIATDPPRHQLLEAQEMIKVLREKIRAVGQESRPPEDDSKSADLSRLPTYEPAPSGDAPLKLTGLGGDRPQPQPTTASKPAVTAPKPIAPATPKTAAKPSTTQVEEIVIMPGGGTTNAAASGTPVPLKHQMVDKAPSLSSADFLQAPSGGRSSAQRAMELPAEGGEEPIYADDRAQDGD